MADPQGTDPALERAKRAIEQDAIQLIMDATGSDIALAAEQLATGRDNADGYIAGQHADTPLVRNEKARAQLFAIKGLHDVLRLYSEQADTKTLLAQSYMYQFLGFLGRGLTAATVEMEADLLTAFGRVVRNETDAFSSDVSATIDLFYPIWRVRWTRSAAPVTKLIE